MAGKGGWHRFGLSWAPLPGSQLQGQNRNLFSTGDDSALGIREAESGDVWSLQLNMMAGRAPAQNLPAPGVNSAKWGDAGLALPGKPTHLVGPMRGSLSLGRWLVFWKVCAGRGEPTAPSCQSPVSSAYQADPTGPKVRRTVRMESCSVTRICWTVPVTWALWVPGEDGGGCLVPKPQGLKDAGTQDWPCAWHGEGVA